MRNEETKFEFQARDHLSSVLWHFWYTPIFSQRSNHFTCCLRNKGLLRGLV